MFGFVPASSGGVAAHGYVSLGHDHAVCARRSEKVRCRGAVRVLQRRRVSLRRELRMSLQHESTDTDLDGAGTENSSEKEIDPPVQGEHRTRNHSARHYILNVAKVMAGAIAIVSASLFTPGSVGAPRSSSHAIAAASSSSTAERQSDMQTKSGRPVVARVKIRDVERQVVPKSFGQKALAFVKRVAPGMLIMFMLSQILRVAFERFKRKQIEKIKQQLGAMGGFDLDEMAKVFESVGSMDGSTGASGAPSVRDTAELARTLLDAGGGSFNEDLKSKMRVTFGGEVDDDIFQGVRESAESNLISMLLPAENSYEQALFEVIEKNPPPEQIQEILDAAASTMGWTEDDGGGESKVKKAFGDFGSKQFSSFIDKAASNVQSDDRTALVNLNALALSVKRVNSAVRVLFSPSGSESAEEEQSADVPPSSSASSADTSDASKDAEGAAAGEAKEDSSKDDAKGVADEEFVDASDFGIEFQYLGSVVTSVEQTAELYKRYAVYCLSSEERMVEDLNSMLTVQKILSISDEDAEKINTDIARGMLQVAASAAVADGDFDDETRKTLNSLKDSFGAVLDGDTADGITTETQLMRTLYGLQSMLKDQEITSEDVKELRRMTKSFGIDLDELLKNADDLGAQLGPEGKEFLESMKELLKDAESKGSATVT